MSETSPRREEEFRESNISRVVGEGIGDHHELQEKYKQAFIHPADQNWTENIPLADLEVEKTEQDKEIINLIFSKIPDFVQTYRGKAVPVTQEHIHFLDREKTLKLMIDYAEAYRKMDGVGLFNLRGQYIGVFSDASFQERAHTVVHELIHFNSFHSLNTPELVEKSESEESRRTGLVIARQGDMYRGDVDVPPAFEWLNEAVTEELTIEFCKKYLSNTSAGVMENSQFYENDRNALKTVIEDLFDKNRDSYGSEEEVFNLFAVGALEGNILPLAKLVDKTYGKGTFREWGDGNVRLKKKT